MDLSIIITSYNRENKIIRLIDSIYDSDMSSIDYEILIIDDCSTTDLVQKLKDNYGDRKNFHIHVKPENTKKSASVNLGFRKAQGEYVLLLDDDTVVLGDTIKKLYEFVMHDKNVIAGPIILDFTDRSKVWFAGLKVNYWTTTGKFRYAGGDLGKSDNIIGSDGILTAFIFHHDIPNKIGGFNETLLPFQFEELDFCTRAKYYGIALKVIKDSVLLHDHEKAAFIKSGWRLYYEVRNRIITAKLWSQSRLQVYVSGLFALTIPLAYIPISLMITPRSFLISIKSIIKGLFDGLKLSKNLIPYKRRKLEDYKNWT